MDERPNPALVWSWLTDIAHHQQPLTHEGRLRIAASMTRRVPDAVLVG